MATSNFSRHRGSLAADQFKPQDPELLNIGKTDVIGSETIKIQGLY